MTRSEHGQATVELVAVLPLLALLAAGLWQAALAGHAHWSAASAARAAARAEAVGASARDAARLRLPRSLERGMRLRAEGGEVTLSVVVPKLPGLPALGRVSARGSFEEQR